MAKRERDGLQNHHERVRLPPHAPGQEKLVSSRLTLGFLNLILSDPLNEEEPEMTDQIDPSILALARAAGPTKVSDDKLLQLKEMVSEARGLEADKERYEEQIHEINKRLNALYYTDLPELMDSTGVPSIVIGAEGNHPAVEAKASNFYRANIAADWEPEKRQEAFNYLDELGSGDLIKTAVTVFFPRDSRRKTLDFIETVKKLGFAPIVRMEVHHKTLTVWLQEQVEKYHRVPNVDIIGGVIGRVVKLKEKS